MKRQPDEVKIITITDVNHKRGCFTFNDEFTTALHLIPNAKVGQQYKVTMTYDEKSFAFGRISSARLVDTP